jgi:hypothetical protein
VGKLDHPCWKNSTNGDFSVSRAHPDAENSPLVEFLPPGCDPTESPRRCRAIPYQ